MLALNERWAASPILLLVYELAWVSTLSYSLLCRYTLRHKSFKDILRMALSLSCNINHVLGRHVLLYSIDVTK